MAIDTSEIRVGASGTVYVAPTGSTLPTDESTALDAAFIELGAINEDGVTLSPSRSIEKIRAWQSAKAVRTVITEDELALSFSLMQFNEITLPLALGGGSIADNTGSYTYTPPAAGTVDERAFVIEWVDGNITNRMVVPRGMVTEVSDIELTKGAAIELGLTVEVLGSSPDDFTLYTDDPAFGA